MSRFCSSFCFVEQKERAGRRNERTREGRRNERTREDRDSKERRDLGSQIDVVIKYITLLFMGYLDLSILNLKY